MDFFFDNYSINDFDFDGNPDGCDPEPECATDDTDDCGSCGGSDYFVDQNGQTIVQEVVEEVEEDYDDMIER